MRILIPGGGIAGLSTAGPRACTAWTARSWSGTPRGGSRAPASSPGNGMAALRRLGLAEEVMARGAVSNGGASSTITAGS